MPERCLIPVDKLRWNCDPDLLGFETTAELPDFNDAIGQKRALRSIEFGLGVDGSGFNLYVSGETGTGRTSTIASILNKRAKSEPQPHDWVYVNNFKDSDSAISLDLPAGKGSELAADMKLTEATWGRASYSSHDGKFVDFVQAFGSTNTQLAGKRFEMSANQLYSAGVTYSPNDGFNANANLNYVGDRFLNKRNTAPAKAYSTYDAGIGWRMGRWEARVDGKNLGNARDAVSESEIGDAQYYLMTATHVQAGILIKW